MYCVTLRCRIRSANKEVVRFCIPKKTVHILSKRISPYCCHVPSRCWHLLHTDDAHLRAVEEFLSWGWVKHDLFFWTSSDKSKSGFQKEWAKLSPPVWKNAKRSFGSSLFFRTSVLHHGGVLGCFSLDPLTPQPQPGPFDPRPPRPKLPRLPQNGGDPRKQNTTFISSCTSTPVSHTSMIKCSLFLRFCF